MAARRIGFILILCAIAFAIRWGNRCVSQPLPRGLSAEFCYRWFRPGYMTVFDRGGRVSEYYVGVTEAGGTPTAAYRDLFGTGRASEFSSWTLVPSQGWTETVELSSQDDAKIDLTVQIAGMAHPLDGTVRSIVRIDRSRCQSWKGETSVVAGKRFAKLRCSDRSAESQISPDEAISLVKSIHPLPDRESTLLHRIRPGEYVSAR